MPFKELNLDDFDLVNARLEEGYEDRTILLCVFIPLNNFDLMLNNGSDVLDEKTVRDLQAGYFDVLKAAKEKYERQIEFFKLNLDLNQEIARIFNITFTPCIMLFVDRQAVPLLKAHLNAIAKNLDDNSRIIAGRLSQNELSGVLDQAVKEHWAIA